MGMYWFVIVVVGGGSDEALALARKTNEVSKRESGGCTREEREASA